MVTLLKKSIKKSDSSKDDNFSKYIERSTGNTTVNGEKVARKFSWYQKSLGLF